MTFKKIWFQLHWFVGITAGTVLIVIGLSGAVFGPSEEDALHVAAKLEVGGVSVNDAGLTAMIFEECKSAFNYSGMGPSRMGKTGLTRFFRQKALYLNRGDVMPIETMAEDDARAASP